MLTEQRLKNLIGAMPELHLAVVGDFFLDAYYDCDPLLDEISLETGKKCYQVVGTRRRAGAAGTVAANLRALGVGRVDAVGYCGDDGEGYELRRAMANLGLGLDHFLIRSDRSTPTYGKPCYINSQRRHKPVVCELERLDIKNRQSTPVTLQEILLDRVRHQFCQWDGLILVDQVNEANCGVLTSRVRNNLISALRKNPAKVAIADSRSHIHLFKDIMIKPNQFEAAVVAGDSSRPTLARSRVHAAALSLRNRRPVCVTLGSRGMLIAENGETFYVPGHRINGPVDPTGAGDATIAALVATLAGGATLAEAAIIANLSASITVQQIGTTGTASPSAIRKRFREAKNGLPTD